MNGLSGHSPYEQIGYNLKLLRSRAGLTQKDLGRLMGVTFQQVQKYETGANRIPALHLYMMHKILNLPFSAFFEKVYIPGIRESRASQRDKLLTLVLSLPSEREASRLHRMAQILLERE